MLVRCSLLRNREEKATYRAQEQSFSEGHLAEVVDYVDDIDRIVKSLRDA